MPELLGKYDADTNSNDNVLQASIILDISDILGSSTTYMLLKFESVLLAYKADVTCAKLSISQNIITRPLILISVIPSISSTHEFN